MAAGARLLGSPLGRWAYRALNLSLTVVAPSAYADRGKLTRALHDQWRAPFAEPAARVPVLWTLARSLLASRDHYAALEAALSRLRDVPVHVLWGERDPAFPTSVRDGWASRLPHAEPVSFPEAGHWPHEEAAEDFVAALRARVAQGRPTDSA